MKHKIISLKQSKEEVLQLWEDQVDQFGEITRIDIEKELKIVNKSCLNDTNDFLGPWITMLDESLHFLLLLHRFYWNLRMNSDEDIPITFTMLLAKTCSQVVAIRKLIIAGLEDSARTVSRSFVETVDLMIVSLLDKDFSDQYFAEEVDGNKFWKQNIAYGRIYKRIEKIIETAGIDEEERENFLKHRREIKSILSSAVHSSLSSAFRSMFIPSIRHSGKLSTSILGHVSAHSQSHLSFIIMDIYYFSSIFMHLLISDHLLMVSQNIKNNTDFQSVAASFYILQDLVTEHYEDYLLMEFSFPEEE
ncbi:hypothetical protein C5G87_18925 [Paenibacillus peoriae]|uniref:hypothetical protein n=1 Tax=Paenibacillus peoriae TaxID=59893 RepID=UPI000CEC44D3|nr:hypothetical protein [Paenibacillus peoriae]PPQ47385.1 hypothetical protein C5G87_18925 [Paenibacillus peoriae]